MQGRVRQRRLHVRVGQRLRLHVQDLAVPCRLQRGLVQRHLRERRMQLRAWRKLRFSLFEGAVPRGLRRRQRFVLGDVRERHLSLRSRQPLRFRLFRSQLQRGVRNRLDLHPFVPRRLTRNAGVRHRSVRRGGADALRRRHDRVRHRVSRLSGAPPRQGKSTLGGRRMPVSAPAWSATRSRAMPISTRFTVSLFATFASSAYAA